MRPFHERDRLGSASDLRLHDHPGLPRPALDESDCVVPFFCFDDRLLHGRHASGPRHPDSDRVAARPRPPLRDRGSGLIVRHGPPERSSPRWPRRSAPRQSTSAPMLAIRASAERRGPQGAARLGRSCTTTAGLTVADDRRDHDQGGEAAACLYAVLQRLGERRPARWPDASELPPLLRLPKGRSRARALGLERRGRGSAGGREARARAASRRSCATGSPTTPRHHDALGRTGPRGSRRTCGSAASRRARPRSACRAAGRGRVPPPARWRDFHHHSAHSRERPVGVPGPLPRQDPVERREERLRGLVRRAHRLPARRRRDAPATARASCTTAPGWSSARS